METAVTHVMYVVGVHVHVATRRYIVFPKSVVVKHHVLPAFVFTPPQELKLAQISVNHLLL